MIPITRFFLPALALISLIFPNQMTIAQQRQSPSTNVVAVYTYADVADLTLASSMVMLVKIKSAKALKKDLAAGVAPNRQRFVVSGDVLSLIRGQEGIDPKISYIIDLQRNAQGKAEKIAGRNFIVFAVPGQRGAIRLVGPDSQIPDSPEAQTMVRRILAEVLKPGAPPKITSISSAFSTDGSLPGESETQLFLESDDQRPVSITVKREQEKPVTWQVAVGETVDDGSGPPRRSTLLWYRLACSLPAALPEYLFEDRSAEAKSAIIRDYTVVMEGLGPCKRLRT